MIDRMYRDHHRHTNRLGDGALDDPMNGEFTQGSMQRLINASMRHQSMNNENNSVPIYFADIGSGSGKVVMHLAACVSNALAIGIEVSRVRFIVSLLCQKEALDRCDEYSTRVLFKYADVLSMDSFGPLTHIYAASAAFPDALMRHLAIMWKASLTAKFLVCNHNPKQMLNVFQFTDLRYVNVKIQCTMHGSGEGKTFYFYERWCGDGQEQRLTGKEEINSTPQSKRVRCISGGTALVTTDELDSLSQGEGRETRLQAIRQTLDEFMNETATKRRRNVMRYTA
ncbi:hypothetical protein MPSEU_001025900 [Mayamaea pseudoterrestris]|nr:hypothetical protein MPSEU_001025900 [Mayamaea pseudoterrestris]